MRLLIFLFLIIAKTCSPGNHSTDIKIADVQKTSISGGPAGSARSSLYTIRLVSEKEIELDSIYTPFQNVKIKKEDIKISGDTITVECQIRESDELSGKRSKPVYDDQQYEAAISYYIKQAKYYIIIPKTQTSQKSNIP
jgi:hypothetical protein